MSRQSGVPLSSKNFGLRSRDMVSAGRNALREGMQSRSSIATMTERFSQFVKFSHLELGIKDMRLLERGHVLQYAETLRERCERNELSPSTAQNYLSAVNRVMELARRDKLLHVSPVREAGIPQRSGICTDNQKIAPEMREQSIGILPERLSAQIDLQRTLGLRFEESCKINATAALSSAEQTGKVTISDGTKGGRDREVPVVSKEQIAALKKAASIQRNDRSLIPSNQRYSEYRTQAYQSLQNTPMSGFHGNRHEYAQNRYEQLTQCACPVAANIQHGKAHHQYIADQLKISVVQAKELDNEARLQVALELGHSRTNITNSYLG